jgi:ABC-type glycerol-3-phosphate transport system substrate-binding protein
MGVYYNIDIFKKYNVSIPKTYKGIERMVNVINGKDKIVNRPVFRTMAERFLKVVKSYGFCKFNILITIP